jgi:spore coat polysaccharide biosynthesis protein SpsF (cytidylyltransferase family)
LPEARVTVDTPADFMQAEAIVSALGAEPSDAALLAWLKNLQKGA